MSTKSVLSSTLLALQLCLGFWQIMKLTPAGALVRCSIDWCLLPLGRFSSYAHLKRFKGRIFKRISCHVTTATADQPETKGGDQQSEIKSSYLGEEFHLKRMGENMNMLLLNGKMTHYITNKIWNSLLEMAITVKYGVVFLKGYKEFWKGVATGGVMSLEEVLDCLILDSHAIIDLDRDLVLPVNLSVSEEKLLKILNLVGLFLQTKKVHWLIPLLLSFTSALLEFCTSLRVWLYSLVNASFCCVMRLLLDRLPLPTRRQLYSIGNWVENLNPSNDIELRVVRANVRGVIGGGAKASKEGAILVHPDPLQLGMELNVEVAFYCEPIKEDIKCFFDEDGGKAWIRAENVAWFYVKCTQKEDYKGLKTFVSCLAKNGAGSLRCCSANNVVRVRGLRESVIHYAKSGFPPVYELELQSAVVK